MAAKLLSPLAPVSEWDRPSPLYAFLRWPVSYTTQCIYNLILRMRPPPTPTSEYPIRVVCISDTHTNIWHSIPDGDILIHAGDLTNKGTTSELQAQINWLRRLPHKYKIVISGNHDTYLDPRSRSTLAESDRQPLDWGDIQYLQHEQVSLLFPEHRNRRIVVYGAPHLPGDSAKHPDWAFVYPRDQDAWSDTLPRKTDILVTHTPPQWHLDLPIGMGCRWLLSECWRVRPRLHVFGHVHAGRGVRSGMEAVWWDDCQRYYERICARCVNAGWVNNLINIFNWFDLMWMSMHGFKHIAWRLLWGGEEKGSIMVNSALMYRVSGHLGNEPQVVSI